MTSYDVNYTDNTKTPITIQEGVEDNTTLDVAVFGDTFLEYGQELNEDILHLLEHFSCPMAAGGTLSTATPDTTVSYNQLLSNPTEGQLWYNVSLKKIYFWDGNVWKPIGTQTDVAANWGIIADSYQLPKPVSAITGYVFPYSECIWSVAPANFSGKFDYVECSTDSVATVNMKYQLAGGSSLIAGVANYLIIGIKGNTNTGINFATPPPAVTPTPTQGLPTPTVSLTPSNTPVVVTPTPTPSKSFQPITLTFDPLIVCIRTTNTISNPGGSGETGPKALTTVFPATVTASGGVPYSYGYNFAWHQIDGYPLGVNSPLQFTTNPATATGGIVVSNSPDGHSSTAKFTAQGYTPWSGHPAECQGCSVLPDGYSCAGISNTYAGCATVRVSRVQCVVTDSHGNVTNSPIITVILAWRSTSCTA